MCPDSWPPPTPPDRTNAPTWATGTKDGVGTAVGPGSHVWFTIARGVLTEVYFPRVDCANTRDLRFVLTADDDYFSDEELDTTTRTEILEPGVPAYIVRKACRQGRYELEKTI